MKEGTKISQLHAPDHLTGRMSKWTPQHIRDERAQWALEAGQAGHSSYAVAEALGIATLTARTIMTKAGWRWWAQPRISLRWPREARP